MTGWVRACGVDDVEPEDVIRFDHAGRSLALYRSPEGDFFATEGRCTHEKFPLAKGLVIGHVIECPKHNGQFDYRTGRALRAPACIDLATFPVKVEAGAVFVMLE